MASLREHAQGVDEHSRAVLEHTQLAGTHAAGAASARREIYALIAALAVLRDEADATPTEAT